MAAILVLDDNQIMRDLLVLMLQDMGHTVDAAGDGVEGIRLNQAHPYDVVITDLIMPEKEGLETIIELHKTHPLTKIIAMSGGQNLPLLQANLKAAAWLGALVTLVKPFTPAQLVDALDQVLTK